MSILTIAHLTFLEARQRRLLWIVFLLGLAFLGLFAVGFFFMHREIGHQAANSALILADFDNVILIMGLYGVNFLGVMLAVLISVDTIAGEIASGTVQTIVTKPLRRWQVILGKWLGLAAMLSVFTLAMSAGLIAIVWIIARYTPPNPVAGIGLMVLEGLVFLTLSIVGGTRLSTLGNGVVVFMLFGLAFIAGWIEQIGALLHNATAVNIGIVVSLLIPGEAMWKRASYLLQPLSLRGLSVTPFSAATAPSEAMVLYTAAYIAIGLVLAMVLFQRRDL